MTSTELSDVEKKSLEEIPHPSLPEGSSIYGGTKVFPDLQAENGESYFTLVHGIAHESSVSFVAVLQATRALRKGFETAIYFYGPGSLNCLATRGFPTTGSSAFPGEHNIKLAAHELAILFELNRHRWLATGPGIFRDVRIVLEIKLRCERYVQRLRNPEMDVSRPR